MSGRPTAALVAFFLNMIPAMPHMAPCPPRHKPAWRRVSGQQDTISPGGLRYQLGINKNRCEETRGWLARAAWLGSCGGPIKKIHHRGTEAQRRMNALA